MKNSLIRKGEFVLAYGSMKSGKSEEIISIVSRLEIASAIGFGETYQLFKPSNDNRDDGFISSRSYSKKYACDFVNFEKPYDLLSQLTSKTKMVGIDELQLFGVGIVGVVEELLKQDIYVVGAGLDLDFARQPFGFMPQLINLATERIYKKAICDSCGGIATLTQRLNYDRSPASSESPVIAIEQESVKDQKIIVSPSDSLEKSLDYIYEARCFHCYEIPDGPFANMK